MTPPTVKRKRGRPPKHAKTPTTSEIVVQKRKNPYPRKLTTETVTKETDTIETDDNQVGRRYSSHKTN